jgi:hypothetical protein
MTETINVTVSIGTMSDRPSKQLTIEVPEGNDAQDMMETVTNAVHDSLGKDYAFSSITDIEPEAVEV